MPPLEQRTLPAVLAGHLPHDADRVAVRDEQVVLTYGQLWEQGLRLAGALTAGGVRRGDRVVVLMDAHVHAVVAWAGVALAGAVHVSLNTGYVGELLAGLLDRARPAAILCDAAYADRVAELAELVAPETRPRLVLVRSAASHSSVLGSPVVGWEAAAAHDPAPPYFPSAWDLAEIKYTSGTTGFAKGVLVSHAHAYRHASPYVPGVAGRDDVNLVPLPLFHLAGSWALVYNALISGGHSVIVPKFSASAFLDQCRTYGATHTVLLGGLVDFLLAQPERPDDPDNPLRVVYTMPVRHDFEAFERRFGVRTYTAYGSTEANQPLFGRVGELVPGGCGKPVPDIDVRLVDPEDREVPVGSVGELVVRPKEPWMIMMGYDGMPAETNAAWRNLWFHTGDLMRRDEDDQHYFVGRVRDSIRHHGENIAALEVESQIITHPAVAEVAVIGVPNDVGEQDVMAIVVPEQGVRVDPVDLVEYLEARVPRYMVPRYVDVRSELPRTPTAKVIKRDLEADGITGSTWDRLASTEKHRSATGVSVTGREDD